MREIVSDPANDDWVVASVELASHELGQGNFQSVVDHAAAVLSLPSVDSASRGVAGILLSNALEALEKDVDEDELRESIELAASNNEHYHAGAGLMQLARLSTIRNDRAGARAALERAVAAYQKVDSALAAPGALLRLASATREDGHLELARHYIQSALEHLDRYPYAGHGGRLMRAKLEKLRDSL